MSVNQSKILSVTSSPDTKLIKAIVYNFGYTNGKLGKSVHAVKDCKDAAAVYDFAIEEKVTHIEVAEHLLAMNDTFAIVGNPGVIYVPFAKTKADADKQIKKYTLSV